MPLDLANWMRSVDGSKKLSRLSIPGTHDSASRFIDPTEHTLSTSPRLTTQTAGILEQLNAGIRFLDLRVGYTQTRFLLYHESVYLNLTFGDVRNVCVGFLEAHSGETIILSLKVEDDAPSGGNDSGVTFQARFNEYYRQTPSRWYLDNAIPRLGDVRGRIVLFRRFELDATPPAQPATPTPAPDSPGINAFDGFPDDDVGTIAGPPRLIIQDRFGQQIAKETKFTAVQDLLSQASKRGSDSDPDRDTLFVNFASAAGTVPVDFPLSVANYVNPRLVDYFQGHRRGRFGIIPMDFQTTELNGLIAQTNVG